MIRIGAVEAAALEGATPSAVRLQIGSGSAIEPCSPAYAKRNDAAQASIVPRASLEPVGSQKYAPAPAWLSRCQPDLVRQA